MDSKEFKKLRKKLKKTQKEMAQLLGTSTKSIQGYEQGWRAVPGSVERQMYFLISRTKKNRNRSKPCWVVKNCSPDFKEKCPAWEYEVGHLCWFINGTICCGSVLDSWEEKMLFCRDCEVFKALF